MVQDTRAKAQQAKQPYLSGGKGTVVSYTIINDAPEGFENQAPYTLGLIKLEEGPTVLAQLTDLDGPVEIGMQVEMVTRKLRTDGKHGIIVYGYKFRPMMS